MKRFIFLIALFLLAGCIGVFFFYHTAIIKKLKYIRLSAIKFDGRNIESNLPLVIIQTHEKIRDEPKITARMKIISNRNSKNKPVDPGNIFEGEIGIEIRGKSSQDWPQKSYGFETRDVNAKKRNVSILNMPKENDWILLATFNDRQFIENSLAYHLFAKMGHYAPRSKLCEVIINNKYQGIYLLTEKIKVDKARVNISKMKSSDRSVDSLTGGYIFMVDYYTPQDSWESKHKAYDRPNETVHFVYYYPNPEKITSQQKQYLKDYVDRFEQSLFVRNDTNPDSYRAYIDIPSFIDYFIISELSHNRDAYKKSCYFYKDKNSRDSLIFAGPVWDFDYAWLKNPTGWVHEINKNKGYPVAPSWINQLLKDTTFRMELYNRYSRLRKTILSKEYLSHYIDSVNFFVEKAQIRHYTRWPILEYQKGSQENEVKAFNALMDQYKEELWLRMNWMDDHIPGKELSN